MWQALIKPAIDLVSTGIKGKQRLKEAEIDAKRKRIENDQDWEAIQAQASASSWKDEYLVILFSFPFIMSFIPPMVPYVAAGFDVLSEAPQWYSIGLGVMISASFGVRIYDRFSLKK